ncbi:MAG: MOSC domain-containing protein [Streptosporangiales bacterium]|nr:MOSC domain-containing protein [Streptosporangiales bacterium]
MTARVLSLHVFPVKACRAVRLDEARVTPRGIRHDREFMVVTRDGAHLSQREVGALATVRPSYDGDVLRLAVPGGAELAHEVVRDGAEREVTVHGRRAPAVDQGDAPAKWLTDLLGVACRLVRCPDGGGKRVNPEYGPGALTMYADGYPVSVVSKESLDELNARLGGTDAVPMSRFRQNVVLAGMDGPHAEDRVRRMRVGDVVLRPVKQDDRCVVTTIDQVTGARTRQPLRTLAPYRSVDQKIMFGMFAVVDRPGVIRAGDDAELLETA